VQARVKQVITRNDSNGNGTGKPLQFSWNSEVIKPESLVQIMWRGRWLVLLITAISIIGAVVYIVKATPIYTSTSRIYVEQSGPKIFTEAETSVMTQSMNYLHTQAELLTSTPIIAAVLEKPGIRGMKTLAEVDNAIAYLKKNLDVEVGKKDDIISVAFDSPYPTEAAQLVNEIVDSYITYHATRKRSTSAEVLKILQTEKARRSEELTEKLSTMMDFKKENESLALESNRGNIVITRLERLSEELTKAQLATIQAKSDFESVEKVVDDPVKLRQFIEARQLRDVHLSTDAAKAVLMSKLEDLDRRRADRRRQLKSGHPAVMALGTEIAHVESQIDKLDTEFAEAQLAVAKQHYLSAKQEQEQIAEYYERVEHYRGRGRAEYQCSRSRARGRQTFQTPEGVVYGQSLGAGFNARYRADPYSRLVGSQASIRRRNCGDSQPARSWRGSVYA